MRDTVVRNEVKLWPGRCCLSAKRHPLPPALRVQVACGPCVTSGFCLLGTRQAGHHVVLHQVANGIGFGEILWPVIPLSPQAGVQINHPQGQCFVSW